MDIAVKQINRNTGIQILPHIRLLYVKISPDSYTFLKSPESIKVLFANLSVSLWSKYLKNV